MLKREKLHDYQNKAVAKIIEQPRCALWLDLGLGKTISTLTAIADLSDSLEVNKVLIIAPLRVANTTWHKEAQNWGHTSHLSFSICTGTAKSRIAALFKDADIYVINRENIPWLVEYYGAKWPFDMVVIDEASSFKSNGTKRFKSLRKVSQYINRLVELTGTPSPNGLLDLWAQMYLLDHGSHLGRTMTVYKQRFFESDYMGYNHTIRPGCDKRIHELLSDITLTMKAEDYLQLPERIDVTVPVELPAKVLKQYRELESEYIAEFDGEEISAINAATVANKLLQASNGCMYTDASGSHIELHSAKLDALEDIANDNQDENILVAYNFKTDLKRIVERFPDAVVLDKKGEAVERWNNGEIKMLLAHPASAGHGINLQRGGSLCVWFGLTWSLEYYQQFNGRLHRQGQTKPVRIVHIVADGCIDERVLNVIEGKGKTQDDLLSALSITQARS